MKNKNQKRIRNRAWAWIVAAGLTIGSLTGCGSQTVEQVLRVLMKDEVGIALAQASGCAPARENCYSYEEVNGDEVVMAMKETAENAVPMPNLPEMDVMWTVASGLLTDVNMAGNDVAESAEKAQKEALQLIESMK